MSPKKIDLTGCVRIGDRQLDNGFPNPEFTDFSITRIHS